MNKKTILFVAFGSLGDINPLLAIAGKMSTIANVVFLANEYFRSYIEESNVNFFSIGTVEDQLRAKESDGRSGTTREGRGDRYEYLVGRSHTKTYEFIANRVSLGEELLIVTHGNLSPAVIPCEVFNLPVVYVHYAPSQIPDNYEDVVLCTGFYSNKSEWWIRNVIVPYQFMRARASFELKDQLNFYRNKMGLAPVGSKWEYFLQKFTFKKEKIILPKLNVLAEIVLAPLWFCEPFDNKSNLFHFTGFPFNHESYGQQESEIDLFIDTYGKPIVFTPGTAVEDVEAFVAEIVPICRKLGSPGIFCSKHGKAAFDKIPKVEDVPLLYLEHAKFSHLLPKSRCLIHHGGIGTMAQAIKAGIPQILRPRMYDQPANGVRVMMYGLGGSILPDVFSADLVADILFHIESSEQHKQLLAYYSDLVKQDGGVTKACSLIEKLLNERVSDDGKIIKSCPA